MRGRLLEGVDSVHVVVVHLSGAALHVLDVVLGFFLGGEQVGISVGLLGGSLGFG